MSGHGGARGRVTPHFRLSPIAPSNTTAIGQEPVGSAGYRDSRQASDAIADSSCSKTISLVGVVWTSSRLSNVIPKHRPRLTAACDFWPPSGGDVHDVYDVHEVIGPRFSGWSHQRHGIFVA